MHVDYNGTVIWYDILSGNESSLYRVWASDGLYQISYGPADTQVKLTHRQMDRHTNRGIWNDKKVNMNSVINPSTPKTLWKVKTILYSSHSLGAITTSIFDIPLKYILFLTSHQKVTKVKGVSNDKLTIQGELILEHWMIRNNLISI